MTHLPTHMPREYCFQYLSRAVGGPLTDIMMMTVDNARPTQTLNKYKIYKYFSEIWTSIWIFCDQFKNYLQEILYS